jgi:hypothetical protein
MRLTLTLLILATVAALPLAAATLDTAKFAQVSGVRLDGGAKVTIAEGQTLAAKVVNAATLAKIGLKGAQNGEVVEVILLSPKDKKFKLMHVPSNQAVTLNFAEVNIDY